MKKFLYTVKVLVGISMLPMNGVADVLHDIDFITPEVGGYSVLSGSPTVVPGFGGFSEALLFHARETYNDKITLGLGAGSPSYSIDFDVVTHGLENSAYAFVIYLATPQTRNIDFHGGLKTIGVFQPAPYFSQGVFAFSDDSPYHLSIFTDFLENRWQVSVNGVSVYENDFNAADIKSMAFSLTSWRYGAVDDPNVQVALDNIRVEAIPEPSVWMLTTLALVAMRRGRNGLQGLN
jgi:hypothetical protein